MDQADRRPRRVGVAVVAVLLAVGASPAGAHPLGQKPVAFIEQTTDGARITWVIAKDDARLLVEYLGLAVFEPEAALEMRPFRRYWERRIVVRAGDEGCVSSEPVAEEILAGYSITATFDCAREPDVITVRSTLLHDIDDRYTTLFQASTSTGTARGALTAAAPEAVVAFRGETPVAVPSGPADEPDDHESRIVAMLQGRAEGLSLLAALALAFVLGALHGVTPGHGKTITAAYLVGAGGTMRQALALGGVVAGTHAISVIALGVAAVNAGQFVPTQASPWLHIAVGVLILALGVQLLRGRTGHTHVRGDDHDHGAVALPARRLAAIGLVGGLVPSPEAIGIVLVAFSVQQWTTGIGLVAAFSIGLAVVVLGVAAAAVRGASLLHRFSNARIAVLAPRIAAAVFLVMGVVVIARGARAL